MMMRGSRSLCFALAALLAGACATPPGTGSGLAPASEHEYLRARWLMVPVVGVRPRDVPDTFRAPRAGNRRHNATDIMAARGTAVVAADAGRVIKLARNEAGGITVYATDPHDRFIYYYAHLDRYHDGVVEGMKLAKGQVLGYVGTTGNAPANTPHLHFQAMRARDVRRWWEGEPLDIRPYLVEDGQRR